jgi:GNAT superfamily N-acetyltransferase
MTGTRPAGPADLDAAVRVWQRANEARGKAVGAERLARVRAKLREPDALAVVADHDGDVVGMALAEPGRAGDGTGPPVAGLCHISMVFVHPGHWGEGVGTRLLDAVAAHAARRGYTMLQLWTGQRNERAQRLYRRAGFRHSGRTARLHTGEPVLHFVRQVGDGREARR